MFSLFLCLFVKIILWKIYQSIPFTKLYSITSVSNQETKKSEQFEINHSNQHNKSALHIWLLPATFIYSKDKETLVQEASPSILISRPSSNLPTGFSSSPKDLRNLGQKGYLSTILQSLAASFDSWSCIVPQDISSAQFLKYLVSMMKLIDQDQARWTQLILSTS